MNNLKLWTSIGILYGLFSLHSLGQVIVKYKVFFAFVCRMHLTRYFFSGLHVVYLKLLDILNSIKFELIIICTSSAEKTNQR